MVGLVEMGLTLGLQVGTTVGRRDGTTGCVIDGTMVGYLFTDTLGTAVDGARLLTTLGAAEGRKLGIRDGFHEGPVEGIILGITEGTTLGTALGDNDGEYVSGKILGNVYAFTVVLVNSSNRTFANARNGPSETIACCAIV